MSAFRKIKQAIIGADKENEIDQEKEDFIRKERESDDRRRREAGLASEEPQQDSDIIIDESGSTAGSQLTITESKTVATKQDNKERETFRQKADRVGNKVADKVEGGVRAVDRFNRKANRVASKASYGLAIASHTVRTEARRSGVPIDRAQSHDIQVNWDFVLSKNRPVTPRKPTIANDPLLAMYGASGSQRKRASFKTDNPKNDPLMKMYSMKPAGQKKGGKDPLLGMYSLKPSGKKKNTDALKMYNLKPYRKKGGKFHV